MSSQNDLYNINVVSEIVLETPAQFKETFHASAKAHQTVRDGRRTIEAILDRRDPRLLVVVGPCSIHDMKAAKEYATRLKRLHDELQDSLYLVMRVYFEKPRTSLGWKGFINDPDLDDSCHVQKGLGLARELLLWIAELGLPVGTEALDPITPQYLSDLYSWASIGARTTESQTHREMASGLSMPVGFKNGTDGSLPVALNAMRSAAASHNFLGINEQGQATIMLTRGNRYGHLILRGGKQPNYDSVNVRLTEEALYEADLPNNIVIDCSHANSYKKHDLQPLVAENVVSQILHGNQSIVGFMLESHLNEGRQELPTADALSTLRYGVSITDACLSWERTDILLRNLRDQVMAPLKQRTQHGA